MRVGARCYGDHGQGRRADRQTGALASNGAPFFPGAKTAIDQQNAAGGINGRKIVEVDADGASTEAGAVGREGPD